MRILLRSVFCACVALFGACGSSGVAFPSFVGSWMFQSSSMLQAQCPPPVGATSTVIVGNLHVAPAIAADLVTLDPYGCDLTYKVAGTTATATGNLACTHPAQMAGVTETETFSAVTLTTTDGKTMTEAATGTADFMNTMGTLHCTFTANATLDKVSNE